MLRCSAESLYVRTLSCLSKGLLHRRLWRQRRAQFQKLPPALALPSLSPLFLLRGRTVCPWKVPSGEIAAPVERRTSARVPSHVNPASVDTRGKKGVHRFGPSTARSLCTPRNTRLCVGSNETLGGLIARFQVEQRTASKKISSISMTIGAFNSFVQLTCSFSFPSLPHFTSTGRSCNGMVWRGHWAAVVRDGAGWRGGGRAGVSSIKLECTLLREERS